MPEEIERIIETTVNKTVLKLKMSGLMRDGRKTAYQKTEELLRNYNIFETIKDEETTVKLVAKIQAALQELEDDEYYDIIPMVYFEGCTREEIAEYFDVSVKTISRNKVRLVNELKLRLFSDDVIFELFM